MSRQSLVVTRNTLTFTSNHCETVNMSTQLVPSKTEMRRYLQKGLTQAQIVDAWEADSGIRVSRAAIAMAIARYDLQSANARPRYEDMLPWKVRTEHRSDHNARMLRLEARRRRGQKLSREEKRWLDGYVAQLKERNAVVTYLPELGFLWVARSDADDDMIRVKWDQPGPGGSGKPRRATRSAV